MTGNRPLWTIAAVATATGGSVSGADAAISGVAIDSREVRPGDLFVALLGDTNDGHDYLSAALVNGAAAALVHACQAGSRQPRTAAG